jgi:hypothetical protein
MSSRGSGSHACRRRFRFPDDVLCAGDPRPPPETNLPDGLNESGLILANDGVGAWAQAGAKRRLARHAAHGRSC